MTAESSNELDDGVKNAVDSQMKEFLPVLQGAIEKSTGKKVAEKDLEVLVRPALEEAVTEVSIQTTQYAYQGPMPHPTMLRAYAELYPDAPAQLFRQFQAEQTHRHQWEGEAITLSARERRRRDYGAYATVVVGIFAAMYIASLGGFIPAAILVGALVLGGGALVLGRQLLASHGKNGTQIHVNSDDQKPHSNRGQTSSQRQRSRRKKK